jgi:hypothetical protein
VATELKMHLKGEWIFLVRLCYDVVVKKINAITVHCFACDSAAIGIRLIFFTNRITLQAHFQCQRYILKLTHAPSYKPIEHIHCADYSTIRTIRLQFLAAQILFFFCELCPLGTGVSFPEGKVSGREAGHAFPPSTRYGKVWSRETYILCTTRIRGLVLTSTKP